MLEAPPQYLSIKKSIPMCRDAFSSNVKALITSLIGLLPNCGNAAFAEGVETLELDVVLVVLVFVGLLQASVANNVTATVLKMMFFINSIQFSQKNVNRCACGIGKV